MSAEWEPGTVAMVTAPSQLVRGDGRPDGEARLRCTWNSFDRLWVDAEDYNYTFTEGQVTDVQPLVSLDPFDFGQMDALCKALVEAMHRAGDRASAANGVHPTTVTGALIAMSRPPKPAEPTGLGAVVETEPMSINEMGDTVPTLMRGFDGLWYHDLNGGWDWRDVRAVKVLSEGVQP